MSGFWDDADVIHTYTREQAFEDGVIVRAIDLVPDEPDFVTSTGWRYSVALSAAVADIVKPSEREREEGQDVKGRLWDLLLMGSHIARRIPPTRDSFRFDTIFVFSGRSDRRSGRRHRETVKFKLMVHGGDAGEPVVTIMLPWED